MTITANAYKALNYVPGTIVLITLQLWIYLNSKQPYGMDTVSIFIFRWENKHSDVKQFAQGQIVCECCRQNSNPVWFQSVCSTN